MITEAQSKARIKEVKRAQWALAQAATRSALAQKKLAKIEKLYLKAKDEAVAAGLRHWNARLEFTDMSSWSRS